MRNQPPAHNPQPNLLAQLHKPRPTAPRRLQVQPAHIRVRRVHQRAPQLRPPGLYLFCKVVRRPQPALLPVGVLAKGLVDGDARGGGDYTGLAHAAADGLADPAAVLEGGGWADDDAADGGAETL